MYTLLIIHAILLTRASVVILVIRVEVSLAPGGHMDTYFTGKKLKAINLLVGCHSMYFGSECLEMLHDPSLALASMLQGVSGRLLYDSGQFVI